MRKLIVLGIGVLMFSSVASADMLSYINMNSVSLLEDKVEELERRIAVLEQRQRGEMVAQDLGACTAQIVAAAVQAEKEPEQ